MPLVAEDGMSSTANLAALTDRRRIWGRHASDRCSKQLAAGETGGLFGETARAPEP